MALPTIRDLEYSKRQKFDVFYQIPDAITDFMGELQDRLPDSFSVKPWTLNRAVSVFNEVGEPIHHFEYEFIENGFDADQALDAIELRGVVNIEDVCPRTTGGEHCLHMSKTQHTLTNHQCETCCWCGKEICSHVPDPEPDENHGRYL